MGKLYEFGSFRLKPAARILTHRGAPVALTPKAFDTLLYLIENAGRTVRRDEIMRALWPDTFVEEGNLTFNISQIRKALQELDPGVAYVQTIPKQGYRFVAEVIERDHEKTNGPPLSKSRKLRLAVLTYAVAIAAAAVMTWALFRSRQPVAAHTSGLTRLTSDSGLTMTPALSPDGRMVAYASDRSGNGNLDLWVQAIPGGAPLRLTDDQADDYAPSFSPDGRTIAFRSERDRGGVYIVSTIGGSLRKIVEEGRRPRFSPDGKWIAYWVGAEIGDTSSFFMVPGSGNVFIVPVTGGTPRELGHELSAAGYPIWAPDSQHVLMLGNSASDPYAEDKMDWWLAPINGGAAARAGAREVFRTAGFSSVSQVPEGWAAGGVLISTVSGDTRNVWRVPFSEQTWKAAGPPVRVTSGTAMDVQPAVAGDLVAFASLNGTVDIWSLPVDTNRADLGGDLWRLTQDAFVHGYPTLSPDGRKLAFTSRASGSRDIWVKDLETGKETAVSMPPGPSFNPSFSPDGSGLIYRSNEGRSSVAYMVSVRGGGAERVCEDCIDYGFSSDGKRLVVVGKSPARVSLLDLDSKRKTALLDHPSYRLWNARFSPEDRWVLFNATTPGRSRIFIAPVRNTAVPESEWIPITDGAWADKPRWSPDGGVVYFVSERDGFRCIWAQRLDAGNHASGDPIAIFHAHQARRSLANVGIGDLGISVGRDKLVFNMGERTGNLWLTTLDDGR